MFTVILKNSIENCSWFCVVWLYLYCWTDLLLRHRLLPLPFPLSNSGGGPAIEGTVKGNFQRSEQGCGKVLDLPLSLLTLLSPPPPSLPYYLLFIFLTNTSSPPYLFTVSFIHDLISLLCFSIIFIYSSSSLILCFLHLLICHLSHLLPPLVFPHLPHSSPTLLSSLLSLTTTTSTTPPPPSHLFFTIISPSHTSLPSSLHPTTSLLYLLYFPLPSEPLFPTWQ